MVTINLKDNSPNTLNQDKLEFIKNTGLAGKKLSDLINENAGLLVFPQDLKVNKDEIGKLSFFSIVNDKVQTGNLMGFIGKGDVRINIRSRFDTDDKQYFLQYMLSKVFAINLVNLQSQYGKDDIWRFLLYFVFTALLQKAMRQGLYKEYVWKAYNDANVKGRININRHIKKNVPFQGNIAYDVREHSFDNKITQLIRHTIEFIIEERKTFNIFNDKDVLQNIRLIKQITPSYKKAERQQIKYKNLRALNHPFFTEYEPLRRVCVEILNHESIAYNSSDKKVYGILFDGAWLWEEYLNTILKDVGFKHAENKTSNDGLKLFGNDNRMIYPDFYKKNDIVIDAKYKKLNDENSKLPTSDYYQVITYMYRLKAGKGILLYPNPVDNNQIEYQMHSESLGGGTAKFIKYGFAIPQNTQSYPDFVSEISKSEEALQDLLQKLPSA